MTAKQAAEAWKITPRRVNELCKQGRITGAYKEKGQWFLPDGTAKPRDRRGSETSFRSQGRVYRSLPLGVSDYRDACTNYYYVDKTLMIRDLLDFHPKLSLFTRPSCFGKTLNMDMLRVFFEKTDEDTSVYFKDKMIWFCGKRYREEQGKYPVIFLSFGNVIYPTWQQTSSALCALLASEFRRHRELFSSPELNDYEKKLFKMLSSQLSNEVDYQLSLRTMTELLHLHHGTAPIVIIDGCDTPLRQGRKMGFYDTAAGFMRNLFSGALKDNPHLSFGFLTSVLCFDGEDILGGRGGVTVNSLLDDRYGEYFGFTVQEVRDMAEYYDAAEKYDELRGKCGGYLCGETEIFNPGSVAAYFDGGCRPSVPPCPAELGGVISELFSDTFSGAAEQPEMLLQGKAFDACIDIGVGCPPAGSDPAAVYGFLLMEGCLRAVSRGGGNIYEISLPNTEVSSIYGNEVLSRLGAFIPRSAVSLVRSGVYGTDTAGLQEALSDFLGQTAANHAAAGENFYHTLILGLCALMNGAYRVSSDCERDGSVLEIELYPLIKGLPDITIEMRAEKKRSEAQLNELAAAALERISKRTRPTALTPCAADSVLRFGIAFSGRHVSIAKGISRKR